MEGKSTMWDFGRGFFEWWAGFSTAGRYGIAMVLLVLGSALCYFTEGGFFAWGSWLVVGDLLLMFAGRSENE
jgi:hypothetical protein